MGSTFKGEIGSAFNDDDPPASELKYVHERARELGFFDWADIAKAFGYRNGSAVLSALQLYEHTDYLVTPYRVRLSQVLQLEEGRFRQQEAAATGETDRDLRKLIENFRLIMANRKFVEARRDFYNIQFPGIGFSATYVGRRTPLTFGQLLSHWHNGDFILENRCCGRLYVFSAGGSPLSGTNSYRAFCPHCMSITKGSLPSFGFLLRPFLAMKPRFEYQESPETIGSLLTTLNAKRNTAGGNHV